MNRHITRESKMLREARFRMKYSQQQVATMIGIQVRQYQRFEYGETEDSRISLRAGLLLCAVLGLDPAELVFDRKTATLDDLVPNRPERGNLQKRGQK